MPDAQSIEIAGVAIGRPHPCYVIAEIGINHHGDEGLCAEMISAAAAAGANAVKLQTVTPHESYHPDTESFRAFKDSVLNEAALARLMAQAKSEGVALFSTPGDPTALDMLVRLEMPAIKISSGLLTNIPLIERASASGRPLILSTGMAEAREVADAVGSARAAGCTALAVLQCTSLYPAPADALNLAAMATLTELAAAPVGYSDHHEGYVACLAAVAMGASLVEKHFTLNTDQAGADHAISLDPSDFAAMVRDLRSVEAMQGSAAKEPDPREAALRGGRHRFLVAARDLEAGERIGEADLYLMRLPDGRSALPARDLNKVVGRRASENVERLSGLAASDVEGIEDQ